MKRIWSLLLILCLLPVPICGVASENEYVARVNTVSLYGLSENDAPSFITIPDKETAERYLAEGLISYYEPNGEVYLLGEYVYYMQENVKLPEAWETGATGKGVKVGVVDSGVYPHTDFEENLLEGYNVLTGTTDTTDTYGHGTRVAGLIAAAENNVGAKGAAPEAQIVPIKCFEGKNASFDVVATGITKAADLGCDIINLSIGSSSYSQVMADAVSYAQGKGALIVAAAGNSGTNAICYPAALAGVIGVGAVSKWNEWESYSQYGSHVDVVAPGCCVGSTNIDGSFIPTTTDYGTAMGTSFAAPLVSGILALGKSLYPSLDANALSDALLYTVRDLGSPGWEEKYGYGLADAEAFLEHLAKLPETHLFSVYDGIGIYGKEDYTNACLIAAVYDGTALLDTVFYPLSVRKGYSVFTIGLPENTKVFLFDGMRPLATPLVK